MGEWDYLMLWETLIVAKYTVVLEELQMPLNVDGSTFSMNTDIKQKEKSWKCSLI